MCMKTNYLIIRSANFCCSFDNKFRCFIFAVSSSTVQCLEAPRLFGTDSHGFSPCTISPTVKQLLRFIFFLLNDSKKGEIYQKIKILQRNVDSTKKMKAGAEENATSRHCCLIDKSGLDAMVTLTVTRAPRSIYICI